MKLTLICGFFLLLGMIWGWGLAKMGKGEMPPADEWIEKEYFDVKAGEEGFEVMTH